MALKSIQRSFFMFNKQSPEKSVNYLFFYLLMRIWIIVSKSSLLAKTSQVSDRRFCPRMKASQMYFSAAGALGQCFMASCCKLRLDHSFSFVSLDEISNLFSTS